MALDSLKLRPEKHGPRDTRVCFYSGCDLLPRLSGLLLENLYFPQKNKLQGVQLFEVVNHPDLMQEARIWGEAREGAQNLILDKRKEELFANLVESKIRRKWLKSQGEGFGLLLTDASY